MHGIAGTTRVAGELAGRPDSKTLSYRGHGCRSRGPALFLPRDDATGHGAHRWAGVRRPRSCSTAITKVALGKLLEPRASMFSSTHGDDGPHTR